MSNPYYSVTGNPVTGGFGSSAIIRAEFALVSAGFDKMPALPLTAGAALVVNGAGTGFATTGILSLAGAFTTSGPFNTTLIQQASVNLMLPAVSDTLATLGGVETLSNKTFIAPALGTPASGVATNLTGTAAGLTAGNVTNIPNLTGPITSAGTVTSVAAQTGTGSTFVMQTNPTLTNPALSVATATSINGLAITTTVGGALTISSGKTLAASASLTMAGTDGTTMTFPGTSGTVVTLAATQTLTNKTLTAPIMTSPVLGTVASGNIAACTGFPTATAATTFLAADVDLGTGTLFLDGPNTGSVGANGQTWLIIAVAAVGNGTGSNANVEAAIFNGSTYVANMSALMFNLDAKAITVVAVVTLSAATTFTLRARNANGISGANLLTTGQASGVANKATSITAVRLS